MSHYLRAPSPTVRSLTEADVRRLVLEELRREIGGPQMRTLVEPGALERRAIDPVPFADELPQESEAVDGDEFDFIADPTNGVIWRFKYREGGLYPWRFVGGPELFAELTDSGSRTGSTAYGDRSGATAGPAITIPLAGDYYIDLGARPHSGTADKENWMSYDIGATGAVDDDSLDTHSGPSGGFSYTSKHAHRRHRKTFTTGPVTLTCKYRVQASGDINHWATPWISATPVRVMA